ncbi:MAG: NAD(P)-binding protein [Actinobacteria bacterium]|nr:NAD(P)-binding protein [Actinomycetota bacterium]
MNNIYESEHTETVIVGGGQAGLAMGYQLAKRGRKFLILEWPTTWSRTQKRSRCRCETTSGLMRWPLTGPASVSPLVHCGFPPTT